MHGRRNRVATISAPAGLFASALSFFFTKQQNREVRAHGTDAMILIEPNADRTEAECFFSRGRHPVANLTEEHRPPKSVFPEFLRDDLPVFGACASCNQSWSKNDEAFRDMMVSIMLWGVNLQELDELRANVADAERHRTSLGMRSKTWEVIQEVVDGGSKELAGPDWTKINSVACRTLDALYYLVTGHLLDRDATVSASYIVPMPPYEVETKAALALAGAKPGHVRTLAHGRFHYTWWIDDQDERFSQWVWSFYGSAYFLGFTYPGGFERMSFESHLLDDIRLQPTKTLMRPRSKPCEPRAKNSA